MSDNNDTLKVQEQQRYDVVFIDDKRRGDRYRVRIDGAEYVRSWRDPSIRRPRKKSKIILTEEGKEQRRKYMKSYRLKGKQRVADLESKLARAISNDEKGSTTSTMPPPTTTSTTIS